MSAVISHLAAELDLTEAEAHSLVAALPHLNTLLSPVCLRGISSWAVRQAEECARQAFAESSPHRMAELLGYARGVRCLPAHLATLRNQVQQVQEKVREEAQKKR